jgi:DNA-binding response OmpR family regulator
LLVRIKAVFRRSQILEDDENIIRLGDLIIDKAKHKVEIKNKEIVLTPTEFRILCALARKPDHVFTREKLIEIARGDDTVIMERTIDVHIKFLRQKLGKFSQIIQTVHGIGYRMKSVFQ